MTWLEFHIKTNAEYADSLSEQLVLLGAQAVTFQDAGDQPIYEPSPGTLNLWQETIVIGLFEELPPEPILHYLENQQAAGLIKNCSLKKVADQDWERVCLKHFKPIRFGQRLWICPSWETPPDPNGVNVILDPGLAFGTGTHPTTALCLEWLDQHIQNQSVVIDYGCGSGILGLAALKLGAKKVLAIDNDLQALAATSKNVQKNHGITHQLATFLPEEIPLLTKADILIANILAEPLIKLAAPFATYTASGSHLLLSGILREQAPSVIEAYKPWFSFKKPIVYKNEWVRLEGKRL